VPVDLLDPLVLDVPKNVISSNATVACVVSIDSKASIIRERGRVMTTRLTIAFGVLGALCVAPLAVWGQVVTCAPWSGDQAKTTAFAAEENPSLIGGRPINVTDLVDGSSVSYRGGSSGIEGSTLPEAYGGASDWSGLPSIGGFDARGWLSQGVTFNAQDPRNNSNWPVTFNDRANEYQMNQLYLALERPVAKCGCSWDFGGRLDLLYGTDYFFTEALGLELHPNGGQRWNSSGPRGVGAGSAALYGLAMPQAYVELFAPVGNGVNLTLGHFYSPLGYEQVMAPENFFYSHSYALQFGEPITFTGGLADYQLSNNLRALIGGTFGWNSFDSARDQWGILAGLAWTSTDRCTSLSWVMHSGDDGPPGVYHPAYLEASLNPSRIAVSSLVFSRQITRRFKYVLQHDYAMHQSAPVGGRDAEWYGINQYLFCDLDEYWSCGMRMEWFRDEDRTRIVPVPGPTASGGNYWALTFGANWKPRNNLLFRPELRWDWSDMESDPPLPVGGPYDSFTDSKQFTAAFDFIVRF